MVFFGLATVIFMSTGLAKVSDSSSGHFDGERFFNPSGKGVKTFAKVIKWWMEDKEPWPRWVEEPLPPPLPATVPEGELHITFINHATFLIRSAQGSFLTDPHFGERASPVSFAGPKRVRRAAYGIDELPKIDFALISHNHYDHMDIESLRDLRDRSDPLFIVPLKNGEFLQSRKVKKSRELDWWESHEILGAKVTLTPCEHWSARGLWDRNKMLWGGFHIAWLGRSIYFAGDTGYGEHFKEVRKRFGPVDLALLPIGAYEPRWFMKDNHMDPKEAVMAHFDLGAKQSLGMHFGTFRLTNEGIDRPIEALTAAREEKKLAPQVFRVPRFGETLVLR